MEEMQRFDRMFTTGEEPIGDRINTYHKSRRIKTILEAFEPICGRIHQIQLYVEVREFDLECQVLPISC
ncbi:unnamed protein product [Brassica oleracea]|uniref:(rape) hypothetical protein n=1 Tax=Brassica napus TaxID=3708 RepID=A0A816JAF7_BRANA|nr:unnamed protein product [Brassica napus]